MVMPVSVGADLWLRGFGRLPAKGYGVTTRSNRRVAVRLIATNGGSYQDENGRYPASHAFDRSP